MNPRGRGRGRGNSSNRGGRNMIIQYGSNRGMPQNYNNTASGPKPNDPLYEEFMEFLKKKQTGML